MNLADASDKSVTDHGTDLPLDSASFAWSMPHKFVILMI